MHRVLLQQQRAVEAAAAAVVVAGRMRVWLVAVEGAQHVCAVL